ncbi:MAG: hypothetical protein PHV16_02920 [Candidatus Nanoarchaeia archaeon]|nr:hypothetical protein [Candidatus Nanoarchaeia archaeon]
MVKTHTRAKRKKGLSPHFRHDRTLDTVKKKSRPKTFSTEDAAKAWAEKNKVKASDYNIEKAKKDKRFKVVLKEKK